MKILVTNDDGIESVGLKILVDWATRLGDVTVSAPSVQQSCKSHAINVRTPFEVTPYDYAPNVRAFCVHSTPVDCIRFATLGLHEEYDLVLSGVNHGFNVGEDILYSGTVGAVFEAVLRGHKALAVSTDAVTFDYASEWLDKAYKYVVDNDLFRYNHSYNINIPTSPKGIKLTRQGGAYYSDNFVKADETHYEQIGYSVYVHGNDLQFDTDAVMNNYVSISPLTIIRSDDKVFEKIKDLVK